VTAYKLLLVVLFGGAVVWGAVRFVQTRRLSQLILILLGLLPLISLVRPSPLILPSVIALAALRWYLQWRERQLPPDVHEQADIARLAREIGDRASAAPPRLREPQAMPEDNGALKDARAQKGWTELELTTPAASLRCEGGTLEIAAGPLRVRARFKHESGGELDVVRVKLALADSTGQEWELRSYFRSDPFTDFYEEDSLRESLEGGSGFTLWADAPAAFRRSLEDRCLLAAVRGLQDSRMYVALTLGRERYEVPLKYQSPCVDVAAFGADLLVRVSGLYCNREDDIRALPAFAYLVPSELLLCYAEPRRHWAKALHVDEYDLDDAPDARAARLESRGPEQASVVFRAG
jgi:hypothetical protein